MKKGKRSKRGDARKGKGKGKGEDEDARKRDDEDARKGEGEDAREGEGDGEDKVLPRRRAKRKVKQGKRSKRGDARAGKGEKDDARKGDDEDARKGEGEGEDEVLPPRTRAKRKVKKGKRGDARKGKGEEEDARKGDGKDPRKGKGEEADLAVEEEAPPLAPRVRCSRCHESMVAARVQITGKKAGVFRCQRCNVRGVQLSRLLGWQPFQAKLRGLSAEQRADFWKGTHTETGPTLRGFLEDRERLYSRYSELSSTREVGEWLPIGVYKQRGFPVERILALCKETRDDPVLGTLYRVAVTGEAVESSQLRATEVQVSKSGSASSAAAQPAVVVPESVGGGDGSSGSAGGGSGSAGGSDPAVATKPSERDIKRSIAAATRHLSRLSTVIAPMQVVLRAKQVSQLPSFAVSAAKETLEGLQALESKCKKALKGTAVVEIEASELNDLALALVPSAASEVHSL